MVVINILKFFISSVCKGLSSYLGDQAQFMRPMLHRTTLRSSDVVFPCWASAMECRYLPVLRLLIMLNFNVTIYQRLGYISSN